MAGTPAPKISVALANAFLDGIGTMADGGKLRIYQGTQPSTPETSIGASTKLAELTMNATAFGAGAANHLLTASAITSDTNTVAGTAQWFRLWESDGTTPLMDGSVDTSGADMNLNSTAISTGGTLAITSFTINLPVA